MMSARARLILWLVLMSLAGIWLWWAAGSRLQMETDITAMLPQTAPDAVTKQALAHVDAALGQRSLYLIGAADFERSEEHTSELQSLMRISYAVFCLNKKKKI